MRKKKIVIKLKNKTDFHKDTGTITREGTVPKTHKDTANVYIKIKKK